MFFAIVKICKKERGILKLF